MLNRLKGTNGRQEADGEKRKIPSNHTGSNPWTLETHIFAPSGEGAYELDHYLNCDESEVGIWGAGENQRTIQKVFHPGLDIKTILLFSLRKTPYQFSGDGWIN